MGRMEAGEGRRRKGRDGLMKEGMSIWLASYFPTPFSSISFSPSLSLSPPSLPPLSPPSLSSLFPSSSLPYPSPSAVTATSPLFAVDCEMCLTSRHALELTHVAVVDERLNCVFKAFVKPEAGIVNYLTRFSGVTAEDLERTGVFTVAQVHRLFAQPRDFLS